MSKPAALLFDVNGTLFPADAAATAFRELGLPAMALEVWFTRVLRDGFAAQLAGSYHPFRQFAENHLACLLEQHASRAAKVTGAEAVQQVLQAWCNADLFPGIAHALRSMHSVGLKLAVLTNGSSDAIAGSVLRKAGVEGCFCQLLDINMAHAWKPASQSYAYAAQQLGLKPEQILMVASHPWDVFGALQAGLQAAYVRRPGCEAYPSFLPLQPQMVVSDFSELAETLAGLGQ